MATGSSKKPQLKFREVYTVERQIEAESFSDAKEQFLPVKDETKEYLYGGVGTSEKVSVRLDWWDGDNKRWIEVKT